MSEVTRILLQIEQGEPQAVQQLLPLVYGELRAMAAHQLSKEGPDQTLNATGLVHEAFLRLVGDDGDKVQFANRGHFFGAAAEAMRRILVDRARQRKSLKRGGDRQRIRFDKLELEADRVPTEFLDLNEALERLEAKDSRKAELVKLRFFAGLTNQQAAEALGISMSTADNDWSYARAWLRAELTRN